MFTSMIRVSAGAVVQPQRGDGIHTLLARHGLSGKEAVTEFIRLNEDRLGANRSLILGRDYVLPGSSGEVVEPLFGRLHERVELIDRQLEGAEFYLVSGHGGPDTGAIGKDNGHVLHEDEYAYDVTLRLGRELLKHGAKVHFIIRDTDGIRDERYLKGGFDERCLPNNKIPRNQRDRLKQRAEAVNRLYKANPGSTYRRCIVVHVDSRSRSQGIDIFFYHHRTSTLGERLAESMRRTVEEKYRQNQPGRGYAGTTGWRNLFMLNQTAPPVVFIELGNIQNERDKERVLNPDNRQAVAKWLAAGVLEDHRRN